MEQQGKKPELGYWAIRGLAQPIRLLLAYAGAEFEDKRYVCGGAETNYDRSQWNNVKNSLGLDFPNLPYWVEYHPTSGEPTLRITQSNAILRHLARKYNLMGQTLEQQAVVDMLLEQAMDFRNSAVNLFYGPRFEERLQPYLNNLKDVLAGLEKYLGDKKFFAGDQLTVADFPYYELIDQHRILRPDCLDECPKIRAFLDRFEELRPIAAYMKSSQFLARPINNPQAHFQ
jgi:glutathione S-transferase